MQRLTGKSELQADPDIVRLEVLQRQQMADEAAREDLVVLCNRQISQIALLSAQVKALENDLDHARADRNQLQFELNRIKQAKAQGDRL